MFDVGDPRLRVGQHQRPEPQFLQKLAAGMESLTRAVVELALLPEKQFAESSRLRRLHFNSDGLPHQKRSG